MEKSEVNKSEHIVQDSEPLLKHNFSTLKDQQENLPNFHNYKQPNNNIHHVVHVGIIIVLLTTYLVMTSVHKCLVVGVENISITEQVKHHKAKIINYLQEGEKLENSQILERLFLEYKDVCKDLEVFTKNMRQRQSENDKNKIEEINNNQDKINDMLTEDSTGAEHEDDTNNNGSGSGSSGNGNCVKKSFNNLKKTKYSIKSTHTKNGFNKNNKSAKAKYQKHEKKDLNLNKKTSTAEPIIYLFALVFIYLLLKAASDIYQHYKSQNKNDKRLRRCSLQSYAQTHRPDRRASKAGTTAEMALKHKHQQQQQRLILSRSSSQDQYQQQLQYYEDGLLHMIPPDSKLFGRSPAYSTKNWALLRQHTATQSVDNSDIFNSGDIPSSMIGRRCSVPTALSYQKQKFSTIQPPSNIIKDHVNINVSSTRRTSMSSSVLTLAMETDHTSSLLPEIKRRVRMINRH